MPDDLLKINQKLIEILSQDKGYFGRVYTWGQRPTEYEYVGYELDTDFSPILKTMSDDQRSNLTRIINYFEIHVNPLKKMLDGDTNKTLYGLYSEWAWSHFMTVVMFGMLEFAVKLTPCAKYNSKGHLQKYISIKSFLETYLSEDVRNDIAKRYKTETSNKLNSFTEVIEHLWQEIRSGFIHEAGIHSKGLEWGTLTGIGTEENPITIETDVPVQELMQITWQAILRSYGYLGSLRLPKYGKSK